MNDATREFLEKLAAEDDFFAKSLALDEAGVGLITAIKEFDYYYYNMVRHNPADETEDHFQIIRLGLPRLIAGVFAAIPRFRYPVITFKSDKALILGALEATTALGFIEQGRRLGHAALAGECEICRFNERQYDVVMPDVVFNMEQHEASVEHHYIRLQRQQVESVIEEKFGKDGTKEHIDALLNEHVYVFREHFIGYDAHPDLDDYFFGLASAELQNQSGHDTYNWRMQFGGVTIQKYMLATTFFLSLALKHERFAAALVEKSPQVQLRDILTITKDKVQLEATLIEALNRYGPAFEDYTELTLEEAKTILRVLSVRRENVSILSSTMAPLPFLIEYSDTSWITSPAAVQIGAVEFLLNSLRYNFPREYDRNQQAREGSMQRALGRLLSESIPGLICIENIKISHESKILTDIDYAAIDEKNGTVILFQLKHQDHYGADIRRRSNRSNRLRKQTDSWLASTRSWIAEIDSTTFNSSLRLKKNVIFKRVYLVVVARHFAHFLASADLREDAAYATWIQLFDALNRLRTEERPRTLTGLFEVLQQFMSHRMAKGFKLDSLDSYHLPRISYRIRPVSAC